MKKLLELGNQYIEESDWKVIAVLKFCLLSLGMILGMQIPREKRKAATGICAGVFLLCWIPLMVKMVQIVLREREAEC